MKNIILLFLFFAIIGCKNNNPTVINSLSNNDSESQKSQQGLKKSFDTSNCTKTDPHIKSVYKNDTLTIINYSKNILDRFYLHLDFYGCPPTIEQYENKDFLYILIYNGSAMPDFNALYNVRNKSLIGKNIGSQYWECSPDRKYHLFEGGTGCMRGFSIYNNRGELLKNVTYYTCDSKVCKGQLQWENNNQFFYFITLKETPSGYPELNDPLMGYIQKIYWKDGKDSLTKIIVKAFIE